MKFPQGDFQPAPAGAHLAQCVGVVDTGSKETEFGDRRQLRLTFLLPQEVTAAGRPFAVSRLMTKSYHRKATLRGFLDVLLGRTLTEAEMRDGFNARALLGRVCMLQVVHNVKEDGAVYANIDSIMPVPKGMKAPKIEDAETQFLSLEPDEYTDEDFFALPPRVQDAVRGSKEYAELMARPAPDDNKPRREKLGKAAADDEPELLSAERGRIKRATVVK
jgi:hypothetical protein